MSASAAPDALMTRCAVPMCNSAEIIRKLRKYHLNPDKLCVFSALPKSHVPVVVCRLAGIRTRGRLIVSKNRQPERTGEPRQTGDAT